MKTSKDRYERLFMMQISRGNEKFENHRWGQPIL